VTPATRAQLQEDLSKESTVRLVEVLCNLLEQLTHDVAEISDGLVELKAALNVPPMAAQTNEPLVTVRWEDLKDVMCLLVEYVDCPDVWSDTIGRFEQALGMTHAQLKARS
jgi:hypothetical protein